MQACESQCSSVATYIRVEISTTYVCINEILTLVKHIIPLTYHRRGKTLTNREPT